MTKGIRWGALPVVMLLAVLTAGGISVVNSDFRLTDGSDADRGELKYVHATQQLVIREVAAIGTIAPGDIVAVVAPFDGLIKERNVTFGDLVQAGQTLLVLDATELERQLRDAMSAAVKARRNFAEASSWDESTEARRLKREALAAAATLRELKSRAVETKQLLDEGIVARREYDDILDQVRMQKDQVESAADALRAGAVKGNADSLVIAELEMKNADLAVEQLQIQMAESHVRAPVAGLILRPGDSGATTMNPQLTLAVGARAFKGQHLVSVGSLRTIKVIAELSELDATKIGVGQRAKVTADAWNGTELNAKVASISAQVEQSTHSGIPVFPVTIELDQIPDSIRQIARIGASVKAFVEIYRNDTAIVVPEEAIIGPVDDPRVLVIGSDGSLENRVVHVVGPTASGVEVEGLAGSETLALPPR